MSGLLSALRVGLPELAWRGVPAARVPEPEQVMADPESADALHLDGDRALEPIYELSARAVHALTPAGGVVIDLGCGSGRALLHLARRRPDLRIIGIDLSTAMLELGRQEIAAAGVGDRVELVLGDMTDLEAIAPPGRVDLVCSLFSMHHLPDAAALAACSEQIGALRRDRGCGMWIFDHARPRAPGTAARFAALFNGEVSGRFRERSCDSVRAAWSFEELSLATASSGGVHELSRFLRLYQAHWAPPLGGTPATRDAWIDEPPLSRRAGAQLRSLHGILRVPDGGL